MTDKTKHIIKELNDIILEKRFNIITEDFYIYKETIIKYCSLFGKNFNTFDQKIKGIKFKKCNWVYINEDKTITGVGYLNNVLCFIINNEYISSPLLITSQWEKIFDSLIKNI